ncbi:MAG: effector binding domain-containing protein [Defluviitaleaceae bacterium]|nr:effector binding domain-containing protein [Defluviitaleaceae bacterium]
MSKIVKVEPMRFAGYPLKVRLGGENPFPKFWEEVFADGRHERLQQLKGRCKADYGICIMHDEVNMDYVIAAALEEDAIVPDGLFACEIPGGEYLMVETTIATLGEAWNQITGWLDDNDYKIAHGTSFEFYDERMGQPEMKFDIYAPIVKK